MADDNDIDISEETIGTNANDNVDDIGNTSVHLDMSIDPNIDRSIDPNIDTSTAEDTDQPIESMGVIDYGVIDVRDTEGGIIGGISGLDGFSTVDLTIVKTESLAEDQIPSSSHCMDEPPSMYVPDSTTGVDYTPRKVDSPANVSSTQEEDNSFSNRLVLGKRKFTDTSALHPQSTLIHNLGNSYEHVVSATVQLYNMQVHLDRCKRFCGPCGTLFASRQEAKSHSLKEHNKQCNECFLTFKTDLDLVNHLTWHRKKDTLKCTACQRTFDCNEDLIQHVYNFHFKIEKFSCKECNAKFTKEANLRHHELSCKNNIVLNKPLLLGKDSTIQNIISVNDSVSGSLTKYVCKICKEIVKSSQRKIHRRKHPEARKFTSIFDTIQQLSNRKIEKDCLISKNFLFFCPKCDCAFSKWKTAEHHFDICKGFTANKKECKKCKMFVAEWVTHLKQHSLSSQFQFIQLNSKNISERLLFECPLCSVCFDDSIIMHHFNKCTLKRVVITKYYCNVCNVYLPINYMTFHNMAHDKGDKFIIIKHGIINEAKVVARKLATPARTVANEHNRKILLSIKEDNDDRIKLIRCSYCGLYQYENICRALNPIHTTGACRSSKTVKQARCCKYCGLYFSDKSQNYHKRMHSKQELTLSDFAFYDSKSGKKIAPIPHETVVCKTCGVHFHVRQNRYFHKCGDNDTVPCNYCRKTFKDKEFNMHLNFHLYSNEQDGKALDSTKALVQENDNEISNRKKKVGKRLTKCPYCHIHVAGNLPRHMKTCKRSNQFNSQYCQICKIRVYNTAYVKHMLHRHNIRVNKLVKKKRHIKSDKNTDIEKDTINKKSGVEILPIENEMHRVYKCGICHIAFLTVAERNIHAGKKCKKYDYESCISCGLIFENHKKHVAVHNNYPSFMTDNIRIVEFSKESLTKYIVRQCKYCNACLMNSSFERHRLYCKGEQTSILVECNKCNLYINRKISEKHQKYHKLHKDFTPSNIKVIICGDDDPTTEDDNHTVSTSGLKRKLDTDLDDSSDRKRKIRCLSKLYDSQSDEDYTNNPNTSTPKRRSGAIEDPRKHDANLAIIYDKVIIKETKKFIVFQCDDCRCCFLTKCCEEHPNVCTKEKKNKLCKKCGLSFISSMHSVHHKQRPDFVRENITIVPVSMSKFTTYRCVRCQICCVRAKDFHAKTCALKEDEIHSKCDICSLRFSPRSFQIHKKFCGQKDTIYVNDFDPFDGDKSNISINSTKSNNDIESANNTQTNSESFNISHTNELDYNDANESKHDDIPEESLVKNHSIKEKDKIRYYRCKLCQQILSQPKSVRKHECKLNEHGLPASSVRCATCKLIFVRPFMNYHNYLHTTHPEKYDIANVKILDFYPITDQKNVIGKSAKDKLKEPLADDNDSADDFDDPNDTYEQNTSKTDERLHVSMENDFDTDKKTLYQCTNCKVCLHRILYAKMHAHNLLKHKKCLNMPVLCKTCNYSFHSRHIKRHLALHEKSDESNVNYNVIPFDTRLVQKPISIYVYKCVCSLNFVEFTVFCSHFSSCDKNTKIGKRCDDCNLNLDENQYKAHEKYHNSKTMYTFDVIEFNDEEVPVVRRLYKCSLCSCHFTFKLAALKHIKQCENNSDSNTCSCGIKFHTNSIKMHQNLYLKRNHSKDEFEIELIKRPDFDKNTNGDKSASQTEPNKYKIFLCVSCEVSYLDHKQCNDHVNMDVPSLKPIKCDLCPYTFVFSDIDQHKKDHERLIFRRNDIQKVILRPPLTECIDSRNKELQTILTGPKIDLFICKRCDVNFINMKTRIRHSDRHDLQQIKTCTYCSNRFSVITLCKHMDLHHLGGKNADPDCFNIIDIEKQKTSITNDTQSTSRSIINDISTANIDDQEDNEIATTDDMNKVDTKEKFVLYKCTDCKGHYLSELSASSHYNKIERGKRRKVLNPTICEYCGYGFAFNLYKQHLARHHQDEQKIDPKLVKVIDYPLKSDSDTTPIPKTAKNSSVIAQKKKSLDIKKLAKVKYFRCKECNVCFLNERVFKRHCNDHEKLPDYIFLECKICHFNFQISDLAVHMKDHETLELQQSDISVEELCVVTGDVTYYLGNTKYNDGDAEKQDQDNSMKSVENNRIGCEKSVMDNDTEDMELSSILDDSADVTPSHNKIEADNTQNTENSCTEETIDTCLKNRTNEDTIMETETLPVLSEDLHNIVESAMSVDGTDKEADNPQNPSDDCKRIDDELNSNKDSGIKNIGVSDRQINDGNVDIKDSEIIHDSKLIIDVDDSKLAADDVANHEIITAYQTTPDGKNTKVSESLQPSDNISTVLIESTDISHISKLNTVEGSVADTNETNLSKCNRADNLNKVLIQTKTITNTSDEKETANINVPCEASSNITVVVNYHCNKQKDNEAKEQLNDPTDNKKLTPVSSEVNSNDTQSNREVHLNEIQNSPEVNPNNPVGIETEAVTVLTTDSIKNQSEKQKTTPKVHTTKSKPSALYSENDTRSSSTQKVFSLREKILFEGD